MTSQHKPMAASRLVVVGAVRNGASGLKAEVQRLQHCFAGFAQVQFFIVESDSSDATPEVLGDLSMDPGLSLDFMSCGNLATEFPQRTRRLAHCRNICVEAINTRPAYAQADYVAVADLDGVNSQLTPEAVQSCWRMPVDWDMCAANQAGPYYDIWALRHPLWSPNDAWSQFRFLQSLGMEHEDNKYASIYARMITIPPQAAPIPVESAFGGLAIYRRRLFEGVQYVGLGPDGHEVCEHVSVHQAMRERGARLYINPAMINAALTEHSKYFLPHKRVERAFRRCRNWAARLLLRRN